MIVPRTLTYRPSPSPRPPKRLSFKFRGRVSRPFRESWRGGDGKSGSGGQSSERFFHRFETMYGQDFSRTTRLDKARVSQRLVDMSYGGKPFQDCTLVLSISRLETRKWKKNRIEEILVSNSSLVSGQSETSGVKFSWVEGLPESPKNFKAS